MPTSEETQTEREIVARGRTAPRITPDSIDRLVASAAEHYWRVPGTTTMVCSLVLRSGFVVTGTSACASPDNFDEEIGRRLARARAREQLWPLEGYRLCVDLERQSVDPERLLAMDSEL